MEAHNQPVGQNQQSISLTVHVDPNNVVPVPVHTVPESPVHDPNICSEVITEEPTPTEGNFPEEDEETPESFAMVEQALSSAHFKEAGGFALEYKWMPCCPTLSINPTLGSYPLSVRTEGWGMSSSSISGCYCCCVPSTRNWQTITLKQDSGEEVLNFIYRPRIWCFMGKKERIIDIYIPQRNKRIGWIKHGDKFGDGAIVVDCVTKSLFIARKINANPNAFSNVIAMHVVTNTGVPVAVAQATRGWRRRGFTTWSGFEIKYSPALLGPLSSSSTKSAILVAFSMWVLTYREDIFRRRVLFYLIMILMGFGVGFAFHLSS